MMIVWIIVRCNFNDLFQSYTLIYRSLYSDLKTRRAYPSLLDSRKVTDIWADPHASPMHGLCRQQTSTWQTVWYHRQDILLCRRKSKMTRIDERKKETDVATLLFSLMDLFHSCSMLTVRYQRFARADFHTTKSLVRLPKWHRGEPRTVIRERKGELTERNEGSFSYAFSGKIHSSFSDLPSFCLTNNNRFWSSFRWWLRRLLVLSSSEQRPILL